MRVMLECLHIPEDRRRLLGPFSFVQLTYELVRVDEDNYIGHFDNITKLWNIEDDLYTDLSIYPDTNMY